MKILIIDDEAKLREKVNKFLTLKGHNCLEAENGQVGLTRLKKEDVDLVLLDLRMPEMDGLSCLEKMQELKKPPRVIMISAHGEIPDAVAAMKLGAVDYLTKPFYLDELLGKIKKLELEENQSSSPLVYASPQMQDLMIALEQVAQTDAPLLLTGETGVGKEVAARWVHEKSQQEGSFVAINCGAIPENLMESELFGHEKGSFSGAYQQKKGKLELAQNGTVFLDEIGELPRPMQVKLLRVLQDQKLERVGGTETISLAIRVIAATNRDLQREISTGQFRQDLYYRLNVFHFEIPPLRERREDILALAETFIQEYNQKLGKNVSTISAEIREKLLDYDYPGNIRELKNIIERSMILSKSKQLELYLTPQQMKSHRDAKEMVAVDDEKELTLAELEAVRIKEVLSKYDGNRTRAAEELGVSRRTIINKIKRYELED